MLRLWPMLLEKVTKADCLFKNRDMNLAENRSKKEILKKRIEQLDEEYYKLKESPRWLAKLYESKFFSNNEGVFTHVIRVINKGEFLVDKLWFSNGDYELKINSKDFGILRDSPFAELIEEIPAELFFKKIDEAQAKISRVKKNKIKST